MESISPIHEERKSFEANTFFRQIWHSDLVHKISETYATQVLNIGLMLITTVLITRSLGPHGRGIYAVAMAIGTLGVHLSNGGLHFSNTYYLARDQKLLSS